MADCFPLDGGGAAGGGDLGLPLTAGYDVLRYRYEWLDPCGGDFAGGVPAADGDFAECDGAGNGGATPGGE